MEILHIIAALVALLGLGALVYGTVWEPFRSPGSSMHSISGGLVASAIAMPAPTGLITRVSGTAELTTIGLPYPDFEGFVIFVPTGAFTGATGGSATSSAKPLAHTFTAVVNRPLILVYVKETGLWYVHAIA